MTKKAKAKASKNAIAAKQHLEQLGAAAAAQKVGPLLCHVVQDVDIYGVLKPEVVFQSQQDAEAYAQQEFGRSWQRRIRLAPLFLTKPQVAVQPSPRGRPKKKTAT